MTKAVLVFAKRQKASAREARDTLVRWLKKKSIAVVDATDTEDKILSRDLKGVSVGVVIGGDGTFLTLVRRLEKKDQFPFMGVNLGTLGFITEFSREEMLPAMRDFLAGKLEEESRPLLHVELWRAGKLFESGIVFNDAVITKDAQTTMLKFDVSVGDEYTSHVKADGYIVSTPTGSTAYNLSAGGPLLHPQVKGNVLVPICAHSLSSRPIIVPEWMPVEITVREFNGKVYLVYDGQITYEIRQGDQIKIRQAEASLRLIESPKQKWSETLRTKLKMA